MHRKLQKIFYEVRDPALGWDDIGGYADVKETLREMVCLPLKKPEMIRRHDLGLPAGVMLWGPLGTGITMLAEACAKEAGVTFVYISGQEMLGKGEELVEAFDCAIHEAPCVLFISDCEWLCPRAGCDYEWSPGNLPGGAADLRRQGTDQACSSSRSTASTRSKGWHCSAPATASTPSTRR